MDSSELVRKISAEVLRRLGLPTATAKGAAGEPAAAAEAEHALVLLTGGNARLDEVFVQLTRIAERHPALSVVLSPSAARLIGLPAVRRAAPGAEILEDGDPGKILDRVGVIYLPNLSLNTASKMALLLPDTLVARLAIHGRLRGLAVVAATDSLLPAEVDSASVPSGMRQRIERLLSDLSAMGFQLGRVEELARPVARRETATGDSAGATAHRSSPECGQKGGGECVGCGRCIEHHVQAVEQLVQTGAGRISASAGARPPRADLARLIDHTVLKPDATEAQIRKVCEEAKQFGFASVCVNPSWVPLCATLLTGTPVKVCTVIGFPLGATTSTTKAIETRDAIANGASEIDMVINVGALKSGNDELVRREIEAVVAATNGRAIVKVILETALLSREEKIKACLLAKMAGADFVKTSTGFGPGGATVEDIALMRETVGPEMGVKASGGIRDRATAEAMVAAGATRIGASASVAIATGKAPAAKGS